MKKFFAILLTLILAFACVAALAEEGYEINYVTPEELPAYEDKEFDPNEEYDMWTIAEYTIEDIQADLVCTVSAKEDFSEFYLECNFYGDDQMTHTTWGGENWEEGGYEVLEDKTGFMQWDTPAILQIALEQNLWVKIEK